MMISFEPGTDKFLTFNESMDSREPLSDSADVCLR